VRVCHVRSSVRTGHVRSANRTRQVQDGLPLFGTSSRARQVLPHQFSLSVGRCLSLSIVRSSRTLLAENFASVFVLHRSSETFNNAHQTFYWFSGEYTTSVACLVPPSSISSGPVTRRCRKRRLQNRGTPGHGIYIR